MDNQNFANYTLSSAILEHKMRTRFLDTSTNECADAALVVLEYINALKWPAIVIFVALLLRRPMIRLLERFSEEVEEFEFGAFGLVAKLRREVEEVSEALPESATEKREELKKHVRSVTKEQFRKLARAFQRSTLMQRRQIDEAFSEIALSLDFEDILEFSASPLFGERAGAAIAIQTHLRNNQGTLDYKMISGVILRGLDDSSSLVRYRFIFPIMEMPNPEAELKKKLEAISTHDENGVVRKFARQILTRD